MNSSQDNSVKGSRIHVTMPTMLPGLDPVPCPEVMTEEEVVRFLRLDLIDINDPSQTLAYYRKKGLLRGTQIGKSVRYLRREVERFLDVITEQNPR
jgi:hypothetical protein